MTNEIKLVWATPDGDNLLSYMARVSNPNAQPGDPADRLINYLIRHNHWSPFEMVNCCVEINTTRDIGRQVLRHRSFSFQEFSQRYAAVSQEDAVRIPVRETRLQDTTNRQHSLPNSDKELDQWWQEAQRAISDFTGAAYEEALGRGIAKEVARAILPEGLTPTRMYMSGSLRSWIHYWNVRCTEATQKEHREIAELSRSLVLAQFPSIAKALVE